MVFVRDCSTFFVFFLVGCFSLVFVLLISLLLWGVGGASRYEPVQFLSSNVINKKIYANRLNRTSELKTRIERVIRIKRNLEEIITSWSGPHYPLGKLIISEVFSFWSPELAGIPGF